jgi:cytoplasmic iron level regulating protein YaaA (DUF328/UPF0246 family)
MFMSVLILLPPSEGKNSVKKGKLVNLSSLTFAQDLTSTRKKTWDAMGAKVNKLPTAKAVDVYSGVLYQALDFNSLDSASKKRAIKSIVIISALFGAVKL